MRSTYDQAPASWKLLWSPAAMAWWYRHRPASANRLGASVVGLYVGLNAAWWLVIGTMPPFGGAPTGTTLALCAAVVAAAWLALALWSFVVSAERQERWHRRRVVVVGLALIPTLLTSGTDLALSIYRDAVIFAHSFGVNQAPWLAPPLRPWPQLPRFIYGLTQTENWQYLGWGLGVLYLLLVNLAFHLTPNPVREGRCGSCDYDLRGTLAAGRPACPECGAPVPGWWEGDAAGAGKPASRDNPDG
jgi:hypothetical protein